MKDTIQIQINQKSQTWQEKFKSILHIDRVPQNEKQHVIYYHLPITEDIDNNIHFSHGQHSLSLPYIMSILGREDERYAHENIHKISLYSSLTSQDQIEHFEAKNTFEILLKQIQNAGWDRTIYPTQPRLSGYDAFLYAQMHDINYSIDATYTLPKDEWMLLENQSRWLFYANGIYLSLTLMREHKIYGKPSGYFISIDIMHKSVFQRDFFQQYEEQHSDAVKHVETKHAQANSIRQEKEQVIVKEGKFRLDVNFKLPDEYFY